MIHSAKWIAPAGAEKMIPCHFRAEKHFDLDSVPLSLTAQIACDSYYMLEINGLRIGNGPARGTPSTLIR